MDFTHEFNNDITILQNNINIAYSTFNKLVGGELSKESAIVIIEALNNFESTELFTVESAIEDKKSILTKIKDFILKLVRMVIKIFYSIYTKLKNIYLRLSKRAYNAKTEVNRGQFNYTNDVGKILLDYLSPFYDTVNSGRTSPGDIFRLFYTDFSKAFDTNSIEVSDRSSLIVKQNNFTMALSSIVNSYFKNFGDFNPHINNLKTRINTSNVILINPKNKTFTSCEYNQEAGYIFKIKDMDSVNYSIGDIEKYMNISIFGSILTTIEKLSKEFDKTEKNITSFLGALPNIMEKKAINEIEKYNPNGEHADFIAKFDKEMVGITNQVIDTVKTMITNNIVDHTIYIDGLLKNIENIIENNTTKNI